MNHSFSVFLCDLLLQTVHCNQAMHYLYKRSHIQCMFLYYVLASVILTVLQCTYISHHLKGIVEISHIVFP